jgi:hypothetical protein
MKNQSCKEFLKERLLISDDKMVYTGFDELLSVVKMFTEIKCREQIVKTLMEIEFTFNSDNEICGIDMESIDNIEIVKL